MPPKNVRLCQVSLTSILIEWDPPIHPTNNITIGYQILYNEHRESEIKSNSISLHFHGSTASGVDWLLLKHLTPGGKYTVSMRGLSRHYPSNYTRTSTITLTPEVCGSSFYLCQSIRSLCKDNYTSLNPNMCSDVSSNDSVVAEKCNSPTVCTGCPNCGKSGWKVNKAGLITGVFLFGTVVGACISGTVGCVVYVCRRRKLKGRDTR